jgi:hypothetical protein
MVHKRYPLNLDYVDKLSKNCLIQINKDITDNGKLNKKRDYGAVSQLYLSIFEKSGQPFSRHHNWRAKIFSVAGFQRFS